MLNDQVLLNRIVVSAYEQNTKEVKKQYYDKLFYSHDISRLSELALSKDQLPYGGKVWRVLTLANLTKNH